MKSVLLKEDSILLIKKHNGNDRCSTDKFAIEFDPGFIIAIIIITVISEVSF